MKGAYFIAGLALVAALGALYLVFPHPAPEQPLSATSVQAIDGDCLYNGGVHHCSVRSPLRTATTTPAAIRAPVVATSTLSMAQLQLNVASSTAATYWDIGIASTPYATTTVIGTYTVPAGQTAFIQASTTPTFGAKTVIPPGYYVVAKEALGISAGDTVGTTFVPTGALSVQFDY